ncbi:hypothetical protein [Mesorhizobium sp. M4B.F.Ca.ET.058.02.1.1]|uniref:hypothetical protein n=1 Tax=Mesorhizobium sp. M4B.F.Ca.ET.058.02.1.1 TaxID=2493675 RepID=UPI000F75EC6C|nr:hypothetical protein [Mesorhizobium sp. M4B.F.Ca.ET.058.02.1.1]AZO48055.1 hypothetical protein EJ073_09660 [Mesorhizobium sp. M4B.F.Ca.ET.058.02.1.1]
MGISPTTSACGNEAQLVDKMIGSAYKHVRQVAEYIEYVKHVSAHMAEVYRLVGSIDAVDALVLIIDKIDTIDASIGDLNILADNITQLLAIHGDLTQLLELHGSLPELLDIQANLATLLDNLTEIQTVAGIAANVTTVAGIAPNVTTVAGISGDVTTVAGVSADVTTVAGLETEILDVPAQVAAAAASAAAADTSADESATSAASALASYNAVVAAITALGTPLAFKGVWDASTGSFPAGGAARAGWQYKVSVPGTVNGVVFELNDLILATVDNASATTFAGNWFKIETDLVQSVAGRTGVIVLTAADIDDTATAYKFMTAAQITKLAGIASGATANDTDANLKNRANHTGTQLAATISDFASTVLGGVLTGLSLATGTAITAADTVLSAFGKLQKQVSDLSTSVSTLLALTRREVLTAARTYYVRTDGNDANNGLANTSGGAFLTIQKALDVVAGLDANGFNITVQVADGTYTGAIAFPRVEGAKSSACVLRGNVATPANCVISTTGQFIAVLARNQGDAWKIEGFKVQTTTSGHGIYADGNDSYLYVGVMEYGPVAAGFTQLNAAYQSRIWVQGNATISGGGATHVGAQNGGMVIFASGLAMTVSGTPAFTSFANATMAGQISSPITWTGAATGTRYIVNSSSIINTGGGGANVFPGDVAGTTATQGQYL